MSAPAVVLDLVDRFHRDITAYKSASYNETQTRQEFIDPLFEALGWDIGNRGGAAAAFREVVLEYSMKIGATTKAPDYLFQLGGNPRFFVEAKKPSVNLKDDTSPAFQLRRYAWSATLPLSVLTDFEEFVVYDCRVEPDKTDKPTVARMFYIPYTEYTTKWDNIAEVFSREAVQGGSLEKFAQEQKAPKGATAVDVAFLREIEGWRELLAKNIAIWNPELTQRELNYAVQMTLDRIIFLRICEDRGIEPYGKLQRLLKGGQVYKQLVEQFRDADDRYNSGLFHFANEKGREGPDDLTPSLHIDDEPLKKVIRNLYYPDSPYEFSVIPVELLGRVYEQFLGKVIHLTAKHEAVVEEKPEVRKAGGVYYTPTYIVDYIVKNTVGKLLEGKTPREAAKLRIVDPACGSGSFLLGAYQYLLDWYLAQYVTAGPAKHKKELYQGPSGEWKLTSDARKHILLNNIYGVDIDAQAVEVTKLSLSLKILEGENEATLGTQLRMFQERALPDLGNNVKWGNSLIGSDFYDNQQLGFLDEEEQFRINVFDWETGFPEIIRAGGFDVVIGNPPWISLTGKFGNDIYSEAEIDYLIKRFSGNTYMPNMYEYFVSQGLNITKTGGYFSFIVPDRLGFNTQFVGLRERILKETEIASLMYKVPFPGIVADTLVFVLHRGGISDNHLVAVFQYGGVEIKRAQSEFLATPNYVFEFFTDIAAMVLANRIAELPGVSPLEALCKSTSGFGGKSSLIEERQTSPSQIQTMKGDSIGRYQLRKIYWFDFKKENITGRTTDKKKLGARPKILLRKTGDRVIATYDDTGIFPEQSLYFLFDKETGLDEKFMLGILNSRLLTFYLRAKALTNKESIAQVKKVDLDKLPIRTINFDNLADKARHDQIVALVERMLDLHKRQREARTGQEKTVLQRQIEGTDKQIDKLVYTLYGLTDEEIAIVEGATK